MVFHGELGRLILKVSLFKKHSICIGEIKNWLNFGRAYRLRYFISKTVNKQWFLKLFGNRLLCKEVPNFKIFQNTKK